MRCAASSKPTLSMRSAIARSWGRSNGSGGPCSTRDRLDDRDRGERCTEGRRLVAGIGREVASARKSHDRRARGPVAPHSCHLPAANGPPRRRAHSPPSRLPQRTLGDAGARGGSSSPASSCSLWWRPASQRSRCWVTAGSRRQRWNSNRSTAPARAHPRSHRTIPPLAPSSSTARSSPTQSSTTGSPTRDPRPDTPLTCRMERSCPCGSPTSATALPACCSSYGRRPPWSTNFGSARGRRRTASSS